jgi:hypothetical protein
MRPVISGFNRRAFFVFATAIGGGLPASAGAATDVFYSGRAIGFQSAAKIGTTTVNVTLADNSMSCQGVPKEETIASLSNPAPAHASAKNVTTYTLGVDHVSNVDAAMQDVLLEIPGLRVDAASLEAHSEARCNEARPGRELTSGSSSVTGFKINGQGQTVTGAPNQTFEVPNVGTIIVNEQAKTGRDFRANAMHVKLLDPNQPMSGDIVFASTRAKIDCIE